MSAGGGGGGGGTTAGAAAAEVDPDELKEQIEKAKKEAAKKIKRANPFEQFSDWWNKKKYEDDRRLLRKDYQMRQDLERFLMEIEEQRAWVTFELNARNIIRLVKDEAILQAASVESKKQLKSEDALQKETGLSFYMGGIANYQKYQNSPAKHLDIKGHMGPVYSVKMSADMQYIVSCSEDKTAKLWNAVAGKCRYPLLTYTGHSRKVTDCDIHHSFQIDERKPVILTCSGDGTIRLWNSASEKQLMLLEAHAEAVYKVSFSADGKRFVSCSEDKTIKMWCFPECYALFTYVAHLSAVTTVSFSSSGRYLISGSDYGERKILLWDADMPKFERATQYPHLVFWTPDGLIKKILIRQLTPNLTFWLSADQVALLGEEAVLEMWPGELEDDIVDSDSDSDAGSDDEKVDPFGKDDVKELNGAVMSVIYTDRQGENSNATGK